MTSPPATGPCEIRSIPSLVTKPLSMGMINCGVGLAQEAWSSVEVAWEIDTTLTSLTKMLPTRPKPPLAIANSRVPLSWLNDHPVDIVLVDDSWANRPNTEDRTADTALWIQLLIQTSVPLRPQAIVHVLSPDLVLSLAGRKSKCQRKALEKLGYAQHLKLIRNGEVGGAVDQVKLVIIYALEKGGLDSDLLSGVNWGATGEIASDKAPPSGEPLQQQQHQTSATRPMSNLLRPFGIPYKAYGHTSSKPSQAPDSRYDPMPCWTGSWIQTPKGIRRLLADELARGLGIPKTWGNLETLPGGLINNVTSIHIWESVAPAIAHIHQHLRDPQYSPSTTHLEATIDSIFESSPSVWTWTVPDISRGSKWHQDRVYNLLHACKGLPNRHQIFDNGLAALETHRNNYGASGAQQLQLLWWEFPPEHWHDLRNGCPMNFLVPPVSGIVLNSKMTDDQKATAIEFVEELCSLGVLQLALEGEILTNCPLFILPKPGQPGQWRVLADMKKGGQNEAVGKDPVYLNRPSTVLPHLYSGGWSAVGDASKCFYQFPTLAQDRPYLGVVHPGTGKLYKYCGLPMGAGNSPAVAGRIGGSLIRLCREHYPALFGGTGVANTWYNKLQTDSFDPKLGHGFVLEGDEDGLPAVLIFCHVDDYFLHGPTCDKTSRALSAFMDKALEVGMLFNPTKVTPPAQAVKYCGFIYDTTSIPTLRIPDNKRERSLAVLDYVLSKPGQELSRLALSIVFGVLQSLVDASPSGLGQTFLQESYKVLYPARDPSMNHEPATEFNVPDDPRAIFFTKVQLSHQSWDDLLWWRHSLSINALCRPIRYEKAALLSPTWGDGSGTGTGGTIQIGTGSTAQWQGQWLPSVLSQSSNWKEAHTCLLTIKQLWKTYGQTLNGTTIFYFTDNSTTYYALCKGSSRIPALHALVREIKFISLQMGCLLEVIHVPGTVMINEGTDGLSRGVWVSPFHSGVSPTAVTAAVFAPVPIVIGLCEWVQSIVAQPTFYPLRLGQGQWPSADSVLHRSTLWCPAPECAAQLIGALLLLWCEVPWSTEAFILVPRVLQRNWENMSRHVECACLIQPRDYPFQNSRILPIPLVLLHISPYVRTLPRRKEQLDKIADSPESRWHREQAEFLRGL